jgi:hypothetical protein
MGFAGCEDTAESASKQLLVTNSQPNAGELPASVWAGLPCHGCLKQFRWQSTRCLLVQ